MSNALREHYITQQDVKDDVCETHKLVAVPDAQGHIDHYVIMVLEPVHPESTRNRWLKSAPIYRRELAIAKFNALIRKVVHNRIVARASMDWAD